MGLPPVLLVCLSATLLAACGAGGPSKAAETRSDKVRLTTPFVQTGDLTTLASDNRHFAWDLYQAVRTPGDNLVFSPASISLALAMTYGGANGDTATQMATTLHFSLPPARLHPTFDALDLALEAPPPASAPAGSFQLSLANALWGQQGFAFLPTFLDLLAQYYGAGMHVVDFEHATETARMTINQWVSDQTDAQITDLLAPGVLTADARLVLTNAVYFHADWQTPFRANSPMGTFHAEPADVQVPMMLGGQGTTWMGTGWQAASLAYKGGTTSMVLIVPDAGTFDAFESGLTFDALEAILGTTPTLGTAISMPRFNLGSKLALATNLAQLGMTDAFDPTKADFSGIDGMKDLAIQAVIHQAMIDVDEKGTTAAAATAVGIVDAAVQIPFVIDRPFVFALRDNATGTILFLGRVLDPSKM